MSYPDWNNCGVPAPSDPVVIGDVITHCRFDSSKFEACLKRAYERTAHARGRRGQVPNMRRDGAGGGQDAHAVD